jgi:hypothetical protein
MAKKLSWGSNFSIEDLRVDYEDDIYENFPFLSLVGLEMNKVNEFRVGDNTVRGTKDTVSQKIVGLTGSLLYGWDRTSWPIPFLSIGDVKEAFDRRHTLKVCRDNKAVKEIPSARYERIFPSNGGIFNSFNDHSILTMAAMWGNVFGPIVEDTKDYMFETACVSIIRDEVDNHEEDLLTRPFVRDLLKHMGCYTRYNDNTAVIERIVTKVLDALKDPEKVVGQLTINNNEEDVDRFIAESDEWQAHNTENDTYKFVVIPLQDNISFAFTYAERLLTTVCKNEAEEPKVTVEGTLPLKVTKVLLWNKENSNNAKKIVASRIKFKEKLNQGWQTRRDNVLAPIENILNPTIVDSYRKKLSDLNLEIWCMNQLDDEDEPFEMAFDTEE